MGVDWDLWEQGRSRRSMAWLQGLDGTAAELWASLETLETAIPVSGAPDSQRVLLMARNPSIFIRELVLANYLAQRSPLWLFLGNPDWAIAERQRVIDQIRPHQIWSDRHTPWDDTVLPQSSPAPDLEPDLNTFLSSDQSYVGIATGGSSGKIRFAMHTWQSLWTSVTGFRTYFQPELAGDRVHSFCTLPLFHVSGLMQLLRSAWSDGIFHWGRLPKSTGIPYPTLSWCASPAGFLSLVPTQLSRLLNQEDAIAWLRQFRVILLGGAPAWDSLLERSRQAQLPLAPTYGMTETAAQVATLKPHDFLAGRSGVGRPLPHVQLHLSPQGDGPLSLSTEALAVGYWNGPAIAPSPWTTGDLGRRDADGYLSILGRRDDTILSGGENVMPQEVEAAILATGLAAEVCVVGLPDPEWGQRVAAVWVPRNGSIPTDESWRSHLEPHLSRYKHPKTWHPVDHIPRNNRGKINRAAIAAGLQAGQ